MVLTPQRLTQSMLFLKMSTDGDDFTESGKSFHSSTTLTYQKIFPTSVLAFSPHPEVNLVVMAPSQVQVSENQIERSTLSFPAMTLNTWIGSPLLRLSSRLVISISANLSPQVYPLKLVTIVTALLCMFSKSPCHPMSKDLIVYNLQATKLQKKYLILLQYFIFKICGQKV